MGRRLLLLLAGLLWSLGGWAADDLCLEQEQVLFACHTGKRLVSVCASRELSESAGYLQLRYGQPEAVELVWPEASFPRHHVSQGELFYRGKAGRYLRFTMDRTRFVVFNVKDRDSGLVIEQDRAVISKQLCQGTPTVHFQGLPLPVTELLAVSSR